MISRLLRAIRRPRPVSPQPQPQPQPQPDPQPEPQPQPEKPDKSAAILPPAPLPVTRDTPFRAVGDVDPAVWNQAFAELSSPVDDPAACYAQVKGLSALALVQAIKESSLGRSESAKLSRNALGLMHPGSTPSRLMTFERWEDGFKEWRRRMTDPSYRGGVYVNPDRHMTLEGLVATYVGGPMCWTTKGKQCANGETWWGGNTGTVGLYLTQTVDRINEYRGRSAPAKPSPSPEIQPQPPKEPKPLTFGKVRQPPFQDRLIPDSLNAAFDRIGNREVYGVVYHRMVGTLWGTDSWFRRGAGVSNGLTDWGIDHQTGETLRWNDHTGKGYPALGVSAHRSPWASGPWQNPPGDGRAFVAKYGVGAINRCLSAIEISGNYEDPLSAKAIDTIAWLTAWLADQQEIPWNTYPINPKTGLTFVYEHGEFQNNKPCCGTAVRNVIPRIIERTRDIMKAAQEPF